MSKCEFCDSVVINKTVLKTHLKTNTQLLINTKMRDTDRWENDQTDRSV